MPETSARPEEAALTGAPAGKKEHVAVLGLGHMGGPMAVNLVKAGYTVAGFDVVPAALEAARVNNVPTVASPAEAVAGADVVLTYWAVEVARWLRQR